MRTPVALQKSYPNSPAGLEHNCQSLRTVVPNFLTPNRSQALAVIHRCVAFLGPPPSISGPVSLFCSVCLQPTNSVPWPFSLTISRLLLLLVLLVGTVHYQLPVSIASTHHAPHGAQSRQFCQRTSSHHTRTILTVNHAHNHAHHPRTHTTTHLHSSPPSSSSTGQRTHAHAHDPDTHGIPWLCLT